MKSIKPLFINDKHGDGMRFCEHNSNIRHVYMWWFSNEMFLVQTVIFCVWSQITMQEQMNDFL
jgi:hypothetical protein